MTPTPKKKILLLCGGVGGTKLAHGFEQLADKVELWVVVNVGDDFEHLGLAISPDLDTVLYTLGGIANQTQGWGLEGESWRTLERLESLGGDSWFRLGDLDLATHLFRSAALAAGEPLSQITAKLAQRLAIKAHVIPATDQTLRTRVLTEQGELDFQHYFVRERCEPRATRISFHGAHSASLSSPLEALAKCENPDFDAVILAPSNPFLSIDPILAVQGLEDFLRRVAPRIVAVSPIIGGAAVKGPAAKLMKELGLTVSAEGWAMYIRETYGDLISEWILDRVDGLDAQHLAKAGFQVQTTDTLMTNTGKRRAFALWLLAQLG